jgi:hypothetical protein
MPPRYIPTTRTSAELLQDANDFKEQLDALWVPFNDAGNQYEMALEANPPANVEWIKYISVKRKVKLYKNRLLKIRREVILRARRYLETGEV